MNFSNSTFGTAEACGTRAAMDGATGDRGGGFGACLGAGAGAWAAVTRSANWPTDRAMTSADGGANDGVDGRRVDIELSSGK